MKRNYLAIVLLLVLGMIAASAFKSEPQHENQNTAATIIAAHRACEAQTGQRCD